MVINKSDFLNIYEKNINIRRLIKQQVFECTSEGNNLKVKITHVKSNPKWSCELVVNIKVSGQVNSWYGGGNRDVNNKYNFSSTIRRNRLIKNFVSSEIKNFFKYFGIPSYKIEIGKITTCENL